VDRSTVFFVLIPGYIDLGLEKIDPHYVDRKSVGSAIRYTGGINKLIDL
jgi:hypothetical protein